MARAVHAPGATGATDRLDLAEGEAHHLVRVLRAEPGEPVVVMNGRGGEGRGILLETGKRSASVRVDSWKLHPPPPVAVTLVQALPKGERLEWILQKSVELGASRLVLVQAERSVTRWSGDEGGKSGRAREILLNAAKQCGQPWLPELSFAPTLSAWASTRDASALLLAGDIDPSAPPARDVLRARPRPPAVEAVIGPEGDFSPAEWGVLRAAGALGVSFGPLVLRTETAALFLLSILAYEWMDAGRRGV